MAALSGAGAAAGYYTKDNYYTAADASETSQWEGQGAAEAGLSGNVGIDDFKSILEGRLPDGSAIPTGRNGVHTAGMDMTFSAPKSVSLLAYIGGDQRLLAANLSAVKSTLAYAEKNFAETRETKKGKVDVVKTGNLVVGLFQHDTSRNLDPQAHVHAVIANATRGSDGKWRALHNGKLWQNNALLGAIYHAQLRANVEALGYKVGNIGKHGTFEIDGVSRQAKETFSTRRQEIVAIAKEALRYQSPQGMEAVTLRSRPRKQTIENRGELQSQWMARAKSAGIDLSQVVADARGASEGRATATTAWERIAQGASGVIERGNAILNWVRERAENIRGRDPSSARADSYLPSNYRYIGPKEQLAAGAVGSAIRHLSERETSFDTGKVLEAALTFGLPVTVDGVQAALDILLREGKLVAGVDADRQILTTPGAVTTERGILEASETGRGKAGPVIADPDKAGQRLQEASQQRMGLTLNPGQEGAGRLVLASTDRVVNVQGVAGSGKSTTLGAIADVARAEGRNVLALAPQNVNVLDLERDAGIAAMTVAKFIRTHERLLLEKTFKERLDHARAMFKDTIIVVDEASMIGNTDYKKLIDIANRVEVGRLAFNGDKRQLGAIEAGKPFEVTQAKGVPTAEMGGNLRSRSPELKAAAHLANAGKPAMALDALKSHVVEAKGEMIARAAANWLERPDEIREQTLLIASGRANRNALNETVQAGLARDGKLGKASIDITVFDKLNNTREEERYVATYAVGARVEFERGSKAQGIKPGGGIVTSTDLRKGTVEITRDDGKQVTFRPGRLADNRSENSVRIGVKRALRLYEGDTIRWTESDKNRGLLNAARAQVVAVSAVGITVKTATGVELQLPRSDPMLARLDLGYAMNTHNIQGATANHAIGVMDSRETNLTNARLFLVNVTRARDSLELYIDSRERIDDRLERNAGDKTAALETIGEMVAGLKAKHPAQPIQPAPATPPQAQPSSTVAPPLQNPGPATPEKSEIEKPVAERVRERQPDFGL